MLMHKHLFRIEVWYVGMERALVCVFAVWAIYIYFYVCRLTEYVPFFNEDSGYIYVYFKRDLGLGQD